ncbi:potassium channel subfamily K member 6 [Aplochiton taeniatus]
MSSVTKSWFLLAGFILSYITYLMLGALVFSSIERPVEDDMRMDIQTLKEEFLNQSCINATSLDIFLNKVLTANKFGVSILRNSSVNSNWDLASSLFFANTLVTTVGYGHSTPLSDGGKLFSIFYALLGVPFTMLVLTACVQRLMFPLVYAPVGLFQNSGLAPRSAAVINFLLLLLLVVLGFFMVPAAAFCALEEDWSFLDAVYFCFISLCTIGLGDFVPGEQPGQEQRPLYKISVMFYLFVGLMMMYLLLRAFHRMSDIHGWTSYLQLPRYEEDEDDLEEDREPIVTNGPQDQSPDLGEKACTKPLDPGSQPSYNSFNK